MRTQYLDKHQPSVKVKTILEMKGFKYLYTLSQKNPGTQQNNNNNKNNQTKQKQTKNKQQPQVKE